MGVISTVSPFLQAFMGDGGYQAYVKICNSQTYSALFCSPPWAVDTSFIHFRAGTAIFINNPLIILKRNIIRCPSKNFHVYFYLFINFKTFYG